MSGGGATNGGKGGGTVAPAPTGEAPPAGPANTFTDIMNTQNALGSANAPAPEAPQEPSVIERGMQGFYDSMDTTRAAMNYRPMMVTPSSYEAGSYNAMMLDPSAFNMGYQNVSAPNMTAAQTSQADIDRFYNPYTDQVVDTSLADIDRARQMQANQAAAQAQAAGAFGGSRGALMEAEVGRNALEQAARTAGQLRQQGFTQAAQLAQQDVSRRQQAGMLNAQQALRAALANQQAGLTAGQSNLQAQLSAALANQGAADAASQFNITAADAANQFNIGQDASAQALNQAMGLAGAGQALSAANQLANLGLSGVEMGQDQLNTLQGIGAQEQGLQQLLIDAAKGQYGGYQGQGAAGLQLLFQALGASPIPQNQTTSRQPGLFDYLGLFMGG